MLFTCVSVVNLIELDNFLLTIFKLDDQNTSVLFTTNYNVLSINIKL